MDKMTLLLARCNILKPLATEREKERRLTEAGEEFDGPLVANWTPNETNADHGYWDEWSERIRKAAGELEAAGETALAGQSLIFCRQIDGRDEVTCNSDFRFEELDEWLAAVMAEVGAAGKDTSPAALTGKPNMPVTVEAAALQSFRPAGEAFFVNGNPLMSSPHRWPLSPLDSSWSVGNCLSPDYSPDRLASSKHTKMKSWRLQEW